MTRPLLSALAVVAVLVVAGCGTEDIQLAENDPLHPGAVLFQQRCAACHTLDQAGGQGSAVTANSREYKDGPSFNERRENYEEVLYAIRNGGFSSGPMPQNIVVGREAEIVACFVATHSGRSSTRERAPIPGEPPPEGADERDTCVERFK